MSIPEADEVTAVIRDMVHAINQGDFGAALAAFSDTALIVEDIAPFRWQGPGAASEWLAAMGANAARLNATAVLMTLEAPTRVEVAAGAAYALFTGQLRLLTAEGDLLADGTLTFTLRKDRHQWLIDTLAWSGPEPAPR